MAPQQLSASLMQLPARLSRSLDCLPEHTARLEHQVASGWHRIHTRLGHAGLDAPVDYLLQQRRAKLHRAAVLALLLMATLGTDDVQAHSQPSSTTKTRPASITGPAGAGTAPAVTRAATNAATTAAMNAATTAAAIPVSTSALPPSSPATTEQRLDKWLRQQPGYPRSKSVTTQLTVVRAPRTSHLPPCQQTEYFLAAGARGDASTWVSAARPAHNGPHGTPSSCVSRVPTSSPASNWPRAACRNRVISPSSRWTGPSTPHHRLPPARCLPDRNCNVH